MSFGASPPVSQVQVGGQWVQLTDFLDQALVVSRDTPVFFVPSAAAEVWKTVPAGQVAGVVFSYVLNDDGLWWQLYEDAAGQVGYVLHQASGIVRPPTPPAPVVSSWLPGMPGFPTPASMFQGLDLTKLALYAMLGLGAYLLLTHVTEAVLVPRRP